MEDLPLGRIVALVPEFAVKDLPKGRNFTANAGTKVAVLFKSRSSTAISGTKVAIHRGPTVKVSSLQSLKIHGHVNASVYIFTTSTLKKK